MADNAFDRSQWPEEKKNEPVKPNVDVRTFGSDVKSVTDSGGGAPKPYVPTPPPPVEAPKPEVKPEVKPESKQSFTQVFPSAAAGENSSPAPMSFDAGLGTGEMKSKKSPKGLFVGILVFIIVVGLAALGYFFVYPVFFGEELAEVPETTTPAPAPSVPETPTVPEVPTVTEEGTTPAEEPAAEEPATPAIIEHSSLFKTTADATADVTLADLTASALKNGLSFSTAEVAVLKEIIFKDTEGAMLAFGDVTGVLLPDVFSAETVAFFENDFTFFTYTNDKGTWLGFVGKVKSDATLADVKTAIAGIEESANLANLFLSDAGTASTWKSGTTEGVANRYLTYSLAGAGLNYGWSGDTLVVSASYLGFQEALKHLK